MIYTNVNNKQEIRTILSALVAMGYSIHNDGTTVDEFIEKFKVVSAIKLGAHIAGIFYRPANDIPQGEFLLKAAQMKFGEQPNQIKLNDLYTAIVSKEGTTVGCQTFDNAKILEVAEAIKKLDK